ncbi:MAG: DUF4249 family protein [Bacteroidia bacterium]
MNNILATFAIGLALLASACGNLEKDITVELPPFERQLNVECYVAPTGLQQPLPFGIPWDLIPASAPPFYYLILTETVSYYDEFDLPIVDDAFVTITYQGVTDTLEYVPFVTAGTDTIKFYIGFRTIEGNDSNAPIDLYVKDKIGREVRARTFFPEVVPIDTISWEFNSRDEAFVQTDFFDPIDQDNYYRAVIFKRDDVLLRNEPNGPIVDTISQDRLDVAFQFTDDFIEDDGKITVGTNFNYVEGDTVTSFIYQIDEAYYDFLETVDAAEQANFSPFAQPTRIQSNIEGGMGIFTAYNYDRQTVVIKR